MCLLETHEVFVDARKPATVTKTTKGESLITNAMGDSYKKEISLCCCPKILPK